MVTLHNSTKVKYRQVTRILNNKMSHQVFMRNSFPRITNTSWLWNKLQYNIITKQEFIATWGKHYAGYSRGINHALWYITSLWSCCFLYKKSTTAVTPLPPPQKKKHIHVHLLKKTPKIFIMLNNWIMTCVSKISNHGPCVTVT